MGGSGSGFCGRGTSVCAATATGLTGSGERSGGAGGPMAGDMVGAMACATGRAAFLVSLLSHATRVENPTARINRLKRLKAILLQTKRRPASDHHTFVLDAISRPNGSRGHSKVNPGSQTRAFRVLG